MMMRQTKKWMTTLLAGFLFLFVYSGSSSFAQAAVKVQLAEKIKEIETFSRFTVKIKPIENAVSYSVTIKGSTKGWQPYYTPTIESNTENIVIDFRDWIEGTKPGQGILQLSAVVLTEKQPGRKELVTYTTDVRIPLKEPKKKAPTDVTIVSGKEDLVLNQKQLNHIISYPANIKVNNAEPFDGVLVRWIKDGEVIFNNFYFPGYSSTTWESSLGRMMEGDWEMQLSLISGDHRTAWSKPIKIHEGNVYTDKEFIEIGETLDVIIKGTDVENMLSMEAQIVDDNDVVLFSYPIETFEDPMLVTIPAEAFNIGENNVRIQFNTQQWGTVLTGFSIEAKGEK